ncbi:MAG: SDR family oxidoreductase [Candidatus Levybacteria bacterium]|nr:SDR family oxidoreductase [Candidatus Levybacteria bacterium]
MLKTSLVAGGAGFIGSHLCKELLEKGLKVICFDNLSTGDKRNIQELLKNDNFTFIQGDITDSAVCKSFENLEINEIYHLASPASVTYIMDYPVESADANSMGTKNLLELAKKKHIRILFASSSEAYGDPKEHPQKETYWGNVNPVGVRSGYDEGKRFGEALCMAYSREFGVEVRIVRIFNTYGPNSSIRDSRVIPHLLYQALKNEPLSVHGDGFQTRSFCYVSDMVAGFIKLMESSETGPVNIGNPDEYKIVDVAKKIISLTNSKSEIKFVSRPKDDPAVRKPDISLAKEKLGWTPVVAFEDGLEKTIAYFKSVIE